MVFSDLRVGDIFISHCAEYRKTGYDSAVSTKSKTQFFFYQTDNILFVKSGDDENMYFNDIQIGEEFIYEESKYVKTGIKSAKYEAICDFNWFFNGNEVVEKKPEIKSEPTPKPLEEQKKKFEFYIDQVYIGCCEDEYTFRALVEYAFMKNSDVLVINYGGRSFGFKTDSCKMDEVFPIFKEMK